MIDLSDRQRRLAGWTFSILFNLGLLVIGAVLLIKPARIQVEVAKASMEIDLAAEPAPAPAITPPQPTPLPTPSPPVPETTPPTPMPSTEPSPFPSEEPTPVSEVATPEVVIAPATAPTPSPPSPATPAKPHEAKPGTSPKASPIKATSNASKGATDAHPDEMHNEPPEYPEASRIAREQGLVILRVEVTATGVPSHVSILQSSGYSRLDQAAQQAIQHWKFHPAQMAGMPVSSEADVPVRFRLE